jgi:hypothetical protein
VKVKLIIIFFFIILNNIYSLDDGSSEIEYSFGQVIVFNDYNYSNDEYFLYLSHDYQYYNGFLYYSFKSQLGISKNLLIQNSTGLSYKNILTGIVPSVKYKFLKGFWGIIPEVSSGVTLDIISLWEDNDENNLIFFTGINLGIGAYYDFSTSFRIGLNFLYDIGYGNFMNKKEERFISSILTFIISFNFYEN